MSTIVVVILHSCESRVHVRGGGCNRPKATITRKNFVLLKQPVGTTLGMFICPHILRVVASRGSGIAILQGANRATINYQLSSPAPC